MIGSYVVVDTMNVHARPLDIGEVRKMSVPLLAEHFSEYGFIEAQVAEDESYDGVPVFRIDAKVERRVPADVIVDTLDAIHSSLRAKGEDRIVFLTTKLPRPDQSAEDEEDVD